VYEVIIPHHKNEKEWGGAPVRFLLPYDLAVWLHAYLLHVWPRLHLEEGSGMNFLFTRPDGRPMTKSDHLREEWMAVQAEHEAPWVAFTPKYQRHIHVTDKITELAHLAALTDVHLEGDGIIMGNDPRGRTWANNYCGKPAYMKAMAQATLDMMTKWRRTVEARWARGEVPPLPPV
jgi:hypothetical protein